MKDLSQLLSLAEIKRLALPSNFNYGEAMYRGNAVTFIRKEANEAEAWVGGLDGAVIDGGGSRRRTQLFATDKGLSWHCAGNPKDHDIFCKHCVALALAIFNQGN